MNKLAPNPLGQTTASPTLVLWLLVILEALLLGWVRIQFKAHFGG